MLDLGGAKRADGNQAISQIVQRPEHGQAIGGGLAQFAGLPHIALDGDRAVVAHADDTVEAIVKVRAAIPAGSAFVESNAVDGPLVEVRKAPGAEPALVGAPAMPEAPTEEPASRFDAADRFPTDADVHRDNP